MGDGYVSTAYANDLTDQRFLHLQLVLCLRQQRLPLRGLRIY